MGLIMERRTELGKGGTAEVKQTEATLVLYTEWGDCLESPQQLRAQGRSRIFGSVPWSGPFKPLAVTTWKAELVRRSRLVDSQQIATVPAVPP